MKVKSKNKFYFGFKNNDCVIFYKSINVYFYIKGSINKIHNMIEGIRVMVVVNKIGYFFISYNIYIY